MWDGENKHLQNYQPYTLIVKNSYETFIIKGVVFHTFTDKTDINGVWNLYVVRQNGKGAEYASSDEKYDVEVKL